MICPICNENFDKLTNTEYEEIYYGNWEYKSICQNCSKNKREEINKVLDDLDKNFPLLIKDNITDILCKKIAWLLPKKIVYKCGSRMFKNAVTGKWEEKDRKKINEMTMNKVMWRWLDIHWN